jgi:hypothetical protein
VGFSSGNSFSLNSIDYGGVNYGVSLLRVDFVIPEFLVNTSPVVGADGLASQGYHIGGIVWQMDCAIEAAPGVGQTEKQALIIKMDNVKDSLIAAHRAGMSNFAFDWLPGKSWKGRPVGGPVQIEMRAAGAMFSLEILATNPEEVSG